MVLKLYMDHMSTSCRALVLFLKATEIEHEHVVVKPTISRGNILQDIETKLPVMDDDGFILTEPVAIFKYLCSTQNVKEHWYPKDQSRRKKVDEYLAWQNSGLHAAVQHVFITECLGPMYGNSPPSEEQVQKNRELLNTQFSVMESYFLRNHDFLTGHEISIADIWAACEMTQSLTAYHSTGTLYPRLDTWFNRVKACFSHFDEINQQLVNSIE